MGWTNFTTKDLATQLHLDERNVRRIITSLTEAGLAVCVGEEATSSRGRPSKITVWSNSSIRGGECLFPAPLSSVQTNLARRRRMAGTAESPPNHWWIFCCCLKRGSLHQHDNLHGGEQAEMLEIFDEMGLIVVAVFAGDIAGGGRTVHHG